MGECKLQENCADNLAVDGYAGIPGWKEHIPMMQAIVKEVIKLKTQEWDKLLDILDDKIDLCLRNAALFDRLNISDNTQVKGRLHCEAYLVSLLKRPDNLDASYAELMEQLKVMLTGLCRCQILIHMTRGTGESLEFRSVAVQCVII